MGKTIRLEEKEVNSLKRIKKKGGFHSLKEVIQKLIEVYNETSTVSTKL